MCVFKVRVFVFFDSLQGHISLNRIRKTFGSTQMEPSWRPHGSQMDPTGVPNGSQMGVIGGILEFGGPASAGLHL